MALSRQALIALQLLTLDATPADQRKKHFSAALETLSRTPPTASFVAPTAAAAAAAAAAGSPVAVAPMDEAQVECAVCGRDSAFDDPIPHHQETFFHRNQSFRFFQKSK